MVSAVHLNVIIVTGLGKTHIITLAARLVFSLLQLIVFVCSLLCHEERKVEGNQSLRIKIKKEKKKQKDKKENFMK